MCPEGLESKKVSGSATENCILCYSDWLKVSFVRRFETFVDVNERFDGHKYGAWLPVHEIQNLEGQVSGYNTAVDSHISRFTAKDNAGNVLDQQRSCTVIEQQVIEAITPSENETVTGGTMEIPQEEEEEPPEEDEEQD